MNPLDPQLRFGTHHTVAHVMLGMGAVARDIVDRSGAAPAPAANRRTPDDLDYALLGIVALTQRLGAMR